MLHRRGRSFHPLSTRCACGSTRHSNIRARRAHDGDSRADSDPPREVSDERISQLRRFLAGRRGQTVVAPETEVPHAVPVGSTGMVLAIAEGSSGGFGARMWPSAKTIVNQIALQAWPHDLRGRNVLELGCGVGMAGLAAGAVGAQVLLTDRDAAVLERAEANLQLNATLIQREGGKASVAPLKWGDEKAMQRVLAEHGPFDFILGSDILYSRAAYGDLLRTITFFSQPHTRTWLACPVRDEGLGEGYGGKYFASVATGITADEDVAKGRKMEHTAFALDPGHSFSVKVLVESEHSKTYLLELQLQ